MRYGPAGRGRQRPTKETTDRRWKRSTRSEGASARPTRVCLSEIVTLKSSTASCGINDLSDEQNDSGWCNGRTTSWHESHACQDYVVSKMKKGFVF